MNKGQRRLLIIGVAIAALAVCFKRGLVMPQAVAGGSGTGY